MRKVYNKQGTKDLQSLRRSAQTQIFFVFPIFDLSYVFIEILGQSRLIVEIVKNQQQKQEFWFITNRLITQH